MSTDPAALTASALDSRGLAGLKRELAQGSAKADAEVARQFEALFLHQMLKSMRQAGFGDSLMGGSSVEQYQGIFDQQLAADISQGRGLGLAPLIERQLAAQRGGEVPMPEGPLALPAHRVPARTYLEPRSAPLPADAAVPAPGANPAPAAMPPGGVAEPAAADAAAGRQPAWDSPEAFVRDLRPHAERAAAELGVAPEALLAQAALETGWGRHVIRRADGSSSHNLFNIKAHRGWDGDRVGVRTLEFRDGVARREQAAFRAYDSLDQAFGDYVDFIKGHPRYRQALEAGADPRRYARELQAAGYATDPRYAEKIGDILGRGALEAAAPVKAGAGGPMNGQRQGAEAPQGLNNA